jgi:hypothetical protein
MKVLIRLALCVAALSLLLLLGEIGYASRISDRSRAGFCSSPASRSLAARRRPISHAASHDSTSATGGASTEVVVVVHNPCQVVAGH